VSDVPAPKPGDYLRRNLERLRSRRRDAPPSAYELALEKGAAGELEFGMTLNQAAAVRGGCWVLHGLVLAGKRADIDHLVIGPAAVTAIDSKAWSGRVWAGRIGLGRGGRAYPTEIDGMSRQINRVHTRLAQHGRDNVRVEGVLCLVNQNAGIPSNGLAEIRGIGVGHPRAVIDHALRSGPCDTATIEIVARLLSDAFVVNGGAQAPTERTEAPIRQMASSRRRNRRIPRVARPLARAALVAMLALAALAALVTGFDTSADRLAKPYRAFSHRDLVAREASYRQIARTRARGHVQLLRIRTAADVVLVYRGARRCRVAIHVSRAAPVLGGGKPTLVRSSGCKRHS